MRFIGVNDMFGESGSAKDLIEKYGLAPKHVEEAARAVLLAARPAPAPRPAAASGRT
jgi:hypothetical protein